MSVPTKSKAWILNKHPEGLATYSTNSKDTTFTLENQDIPELKPTQVLLKTFYLSNDPAQRGWIAGDIPPERLYVPPVPLGSPMRSRGLAEVLAVGSDVASSLEKAGKPSVAVGDLVQCQVNWVEFPVVEAGEVAKIDKNLPGGLSVTHYLGALGGPGLTAYYGLVVICEAKKGERIVVSGAAGATGSMVVQIAKNIVGASNVIGIAGTDEKCKWVESLGADKCLNYKSKTFQSDLKSATSEGIDIYFDNVGGDILDNVLGLMSRYGRVACCGAITGYNSDNSCVLKNYFQIITMRLSLRGFIVTDFLSKARETIGMFIGALKDGKLKLSDENETVVQSSFEEIPETWLKLFKGGNQGKLVTKL